MVKGPRETSSAGTIRPLNLPVPLEVQEDEDGLPFALTLNGKKLDITSVDDRWEIADEWWRAVPIARRYYQVTTQDGRHITLFEDLAAGGWYQQQG